MKFDESTIIGKEVQFAKALQAFSEAGFVHAGQWDYERVTFDYKIDDLAANDIYYLRVQAYATKGEIPSPSSTIKFIAPILGKHYYPHGVEYEGEDFPKHVIEKSKKKIEQIEQTIK